mgnify:CR=1 FL=1
MPKVRVIASVGGGGGSREDVSRFLVFFNEAHTRGLFSRLGEAQKRSNGRGREGWKETLR